MNAPRDPERLIHAFLMEGQTELADPVYDAVRASIDHKRQRVVIGPWRMPDMNKFVPIGLAAAAVVVVAVVGAQLLGPPAPGDVGVAPSASPTGTPSATPVGDIVQYQLDGAPATTEVNVVTDGASVSGTAVTTFRGRTHTVGLKCAADYGDTWALGGTVEESTAEAGSVGSWSAVIVKEGSPQQIALHLSDAEWEGSDCGDWLASVDYSRIDPSNFQPVESGELVPPPGLATGGVGDIVQYQLDGAPATTEVNVVADGASVSGTAVTTFRGGTHTVGLECAADYGDTWALGGTVEESTVEAGSVGSWSAVIVMDGTPQQIATWLSDAKSEGTDCDGWLAAIDLGTIDPSFFQPVESGELVPPPGLAP